MALIASLAVMAWSEASWSAIHWDVFTSSLRQLSLVLTACSSDASTPACKHSVTQGVAQVMTRAC